MEVEQTHWETRARKEVFVQTGWLSALGFWRNSLIITITLHTHLIQLIWVGLHFFWVFEIHNFQILEWWRRNLYIIFHSYQVWVIRLMNIWIVTLLRELKLSRSFPQVRFWGLTSSGQICSESELSELQKCRYLRTNVYKERDKSSHCRSQGFLCSLDLRVCYFGERRELSLCCILNYGN